VKRCSGFNSVLFRLLSGCSVLPPLSLMIFLFRFYSVYVIVYLTVYFVVYFLGRTCCGEWQFIAEKCLGVVRLLLPIQTRRPRTVSRLSSSLIIKRCTKSQHSGLPSRPIPFPISYTVSDSNMHLNSALAGQAFFSGFTGVSHFTYDRRWRRKVDCEYACCEQFHSHNELVVHCLMSGGSYWMLRGRW